MFLYEHWMALSLVSFQLISGGAWLKNVFDPMHVFPSWRNVDFMILWSRLLRGCTSILSMADQQCTHCPLRDLHVSGTALICKAPPKFLVCSTSSESRTPCTANHLCESPIFAWDFEARCYCWVVHHVKAIGLVIYFAVWWGQTASHVLLFNFILHCNYRFIMWNI